MKLITEELEKGNSGEASQNRQQDALAILRTETALSRFPLHRLSKGRAVQIELENQASAVLWRVDHNSRYGQPGALAYKLDSLLINRRIEETGRPVPKTIRLGSLREIAAEVGSGTNTSAVKKALLQNATASITAKISYRTQNDGEQWLEAVFNRYSVVFTGEKFPQGGTADAVYLVLNDVYQQILNTAIYRPLDYAYMKSLPPIAQRFYEIVSYQIYAALKHNNPRARVLYSEYCLLSTAARYYDFDHVKKQMYKVLRPHIQSGYIAKVEYEAITNDRGEQDWWMYLTPGLNAGREFQAFTGQAHPRRAHKTHTTESNALTLPFPDDPPPKLSTSNPPPASATAQATTTDDPPMEAGGIIQKPARVQRRVARNTIQPNIPQDLSQSQQELLQRLLDLKISPEVGHELILDIPESTITQQLDCLSDREPRDLAATFVKAVREGWAPPKKYFERMEAAESAEKARAGKEAARAKKAAQQAVEREKTAVAEQESAMLDVMFAKLDPRTQQRIEAQAKERLGVLGRSGQANAALTAMRRNLLREMLGKVQDDSAGT